MKPLTLVAVIFLGGCLLLSACGGAGDDFAKNEPLPAVPTPTPVPLLCGNGVLDAQFEQCDIGNTQNCASGQTCVCCVCTDGGPLGDREFKIANIPTTQFVNSFVQTNVAVPGSLSAGASFTLHAGNVPPPTNPQQPFGDECQVPLSLGADTVFGFAVLDTSILCVKAFAEGSTGVLDCDGGSPQDVLLTQDSRGNEIAGPSQLTTGLGDAGAAGPGAATLILQRFINVRLPSGHTPADCVNVDYDNPQSFDPNIGRADVIDVRPDALTTQTSVTILTNAVPAPDKMITVFAGGNFNCGTWTDPNDTPRAFTIPVPGEDTPIGDTANALLFKEQRP